MCFASNPSSFPHARSREVTTSRQHKLRSIQNFVVQHKARGKEFTIKECLDAKNYISVVSLDRSTFKTNIFGQEMLSGKMAAIFCSPSVQEDAETRNLLITRGRMLNETIQTT